MIFKPKVVLDTSVFISALLSSNVNSAPNQIIRRWRNRDFILIMTPKLSEEIAVVLSRKGVEEELMIELFESI